VWNQDIFVLLFLKTDSKIGKRSNSIKKTAHRKNFVSTKMELQYIIPAYGNSYSIEGENYFYPNEEGITSYVKHDVINYITFYSSTTQCVFLSISITVRDNPASMKFKLGDQSKTMVIKTSDKYILPIGVFEVTEGYNNLEMSGAKTTNYNCYATIHSIVVLSKAEIEFELKQPISSMMGPTCMIEYSLPKDVECQAFYAEIMIPETSKYTYYTVINSMGASVYPATSSDNKKSINIYIRASDSVYRTHEELDVNKVKLINKGENVEESAVAYKPDLHCTFTYDWKILETYRFVLSVRPVKCLGNMTEHTVYFWHPGKEKWDLLVRALQPGVSSKITKVTSSIAPNAKGASSIRRKAIVGNQWVHEGKQWIEINEATFIESNNCYRKDMCVEMVDNKFVLETCGFINKRTQIGQKFLRKHSPPNINLEVL